jgi:hypothetical protein
VRDMANQLLAVRGRGEVGEKWASNLVRRKPELKSRLARRRDRQRVLCSDPKIVSPWFDLVQSTKTKYGILDEDTYNFDETGFTMGVAGSVKVVTASQRRNRPLGVQPGNREWVTLIAGVNAPGWAIPRDAKYVHSFLEKMYAYLSKLKITRLDIPVLLRFFRLMLLSSFVAVSIDFAPGSCY